MEGLTLTPLADPQLLIVSMARLIFIRAWMWTIIPGYPAVVSILSFQLKGPISVRDLTTSVVFWSQSMKMGLPSILPQAIKHVRLKFFVNPRYTEEGLDFIVTSSIWDCWHEIITENLKLHFSIFTQIFQFRLPSFEWHWTYRKLFNMSHSVIRHIWVGCRAGRRRHWLE